MLKNPSKIQNIKISNIYNFLYLLLSDKKEFKINIENEREKCLKIIIKALFTKLFENKIFDFINGKDIEDSDNKNLTNFFMDPSHFIYQNIEHKIKNIFNNISKKSDDLIKIFINFKSSIPGTIEEIKNESENEIRALKESYKNEQERKREALLQENIDNTNRLKNDYIESLNNFIKSEDKEIYKFDPIEIQELINKIIYLKQIKTKIKNEKNISLNNVDSSELEYEDNNISNIDSSEINQKLNNISIDIKKQ